MEEKRKEALGWFVQFANMDLNELRLGDKAKLLVESEEYLSPKKDFEGFYPFPRHQFDEAGLDLLGKMAWVSKIPARDTPQYLDTLKELQKSVIAAFRIFDQMGDGSILVRPDSITIMKGSGTLSSSESSFQFDSSGFMWRGESIIQTNWDRTFNLSFFPLAKTLDKYIELKLYQVLNGFPRQTIRKCQGCKKYFLNATFRKKKFCSPRCMWRFNAEKRRKDDPETYKKYQKEVMRDKYRIEKGMKPKKFYKSERRKKN